MAHPGTVRRDRSLVWGKRGERDMPFQSFEATVDRVRDLTHDVRELHFRLLKPTVINFKAGQFISFDVTPRGAALAVIRPYSIASPPSESQSITIVLNRVPDGVGSTYLFSLKEGDTAVFQGPMGSFYQRDDSRDLLFVATGTGIAPIRSMVLDLTVRRYPGTLTLYWGLRTERDLYYQVEWKALMARYPNVSVEIALSRPTVGWQGYTGRVTGLVEERITSVKNRAVYLCGNHAMISDVTRIINKKGLCPVYREIYYDDPNSVPDY